MAAGGFKACLCHRVVNGFIFFIVMGDCGLAKKDEGEFHGTSSMSVTE